MRKITSLLMLFLLFWGIGANAEVIKVYRPTNRVAELKTDGTKYMIFNAVNYPGMYGARYGFVSNNGSGLNKPKVKPSEMEALSDAHLFTLEVSTNANAYYIKSVSTNKYVNHEGNTNNADPQDCYIYKWTETPATKGGFASVMSKDDESVMLATADITDAECLFSISNASTTNENGVTTWRGWNGNEGSFTAWSDVHPYAFYEVEEVEVEVPTNAVTELANLSNDKLYLIKNARTANTALVHKAGVSDVVWNGKETSILYDPRSNNFRWAIYKSSNNNYYLYNVGAGKYMGSAMAADAPIPFVDATGLHSIEIEKKANNADYPFMLSSNSGKGSVNTSSSWWHAGSGTINWRTGYTHPEDNGNSFAFYEVADISAELLSTIQTAVADYEANGVANWKNANPANGYVGAYPASDTYNAIDSEEDIDNFLYNAPAKIAMTPGYYYIKGTGTSNDVNWYVTHQDGKLFGKALSASNADYIWKAEEVDGKYKFQCVNLQKYMNIENASANGGSASALVAAENASAMTLTDKGFGKFSIVQTVVKENPDGSTTTDNWNLRSENGGALNYWSGENEPNETWYIIPATSLDITMKEAQGGAYTSIYLPFAVTLDEGTKAYAGEVSDAKDVLNMTEVGNVVPAETPVVLVSDNVGAHTLTIGGTADAVENNDLEGTLTPIVFADNKADYLIFGIANKKAGFYTSAGTQISANKAYLPASLVAAAQTVKMNFGGEATGIEAIEKADNAKAPIYDLSGRRVVNTAKGGIYIQNGRKFIVK